MIGFEHAAGTRPIRGYTIGHALGRGGFGEVYYAVSDAGRQVALKAIRHHEEVELRGLAHCMNLKSPHLVMIFDIHRDDDGNPWVIMEYVDGPSLRDLLEEAAASDQGPGLGEQKAAFLIREIARGLTELHEAGIVHRDLKPENIFIEHGVVKIGDYSLSKSMLLSEGSRHTATVGSVHYMAPEISEGQYGTSVDIYSLGVILHEVLVGHAPHRGESVGEVLMKHLRGDLALDGISPHFANCIRTAMHRDPNMRYASADAMAQDLMRDESLAAMANSIRPRSLSMVGHRPAPAVQNSTYRNADRETPVSAKRSRDRRMTSDLPKPLTESVFAVERWKRFVFGEVVSTILFMAVAWMLLIFTLVFQGRVHPETAFFLAVAVCLGGRMATWLYRQAMSNQRIHDWFHGAISGPILNRIYTVLWIIPGSIFVGAMSRGADDEQLLVFFWPMVLIDWMLTTHPRRKYRFDFARLALVGLIAACSSMFVSNGPPSILFDAAGVMVAMLMLQAASPLMTDPEDSSFGSRLLRGVLR